MRKRWAVITNGNGKLDIRRTWTKYGALELWDRLKLIEAAMPEPRTWVVGRLLEETPDGITMGNVHTERTRKP